MRIATRIAVVVVIIFLTVLVVMQYQWFSRAAGSEVSEAVRGLRLQVLQTVAAEYRKYLPLWQDLAQLDFGRDTRPFDSILRDYGPNSRTQNLLLSVEGMSQFGNQLSTRNGNQKIIVFNEGEYDGSIGLVFEQKINGEKVNHILVLDYKRFVSDNLYPALKTLLEGYSISIDWDINSEKDVTQKNRRFLKPEPERIEAEFFNPFLVLLGRGSLIDRQKGLSIPLSPDFPELMMGGGSRIPFQVLHVLPQAQSSLVQKEYGLAFNWLLSLLLILGTGAAFVIVILQADRLARRQEQERDFVASITHELRTPLTVIQSASDNLSRGLVQGQRVPEYGGLIQNEARRLNRMIEEVLAFSRLETKAGKKILTTACKPRELFEEVLNSFTELAQAKKLCLVRDFDSVPVEAQSNSDSLRLILANLVLNAINHAYQDYDEVEPGATRDKTRDIRVRAHVRIPHTLVISIEDDGRGIARKEQSKIFRAFYRDTVSVSRQERGSGLGLFLVAQHARLLGGSIQVESPYKRLDSTKASGAKFTCTISLLGAKL